MGETGQLDLLPDSPAYATQLRLISSRVIAGANQEVGTDAVRGVRVLAVGAAPEARVAEPSPQTAATSQAPVKTRDTASPGYQQALAAHQAVAPARHVDPGIAEALERQTRAMRELSRWAFPESEAFSDDQPTPIEAAHVQRRRESDATYALALRRARAERAQRAHPGADAAMAGGFRSAHRAGGVRLRHIARTQRAADKPQLHG